jgi:hypothetical protein
MLPQKLIITMRTQEKEEREMKWNIERCHYPDYTYLQESHHNIEAHITTHKEMQASIAALGRKL